MANPTFSGVFETVLASLLTAGLLKFLNNVLATLLATYVSHEGNEHDRYGWLYAVCHFNVLAVMYREREFLKQLKLKLGVTELSKVNDDGTDIEDIDDAEVYPRIKLGRALALQAFITFVLTVLPAVLLATKIRSLKYVRSNIPTIHLPLAEVGNRSAPLIPFMDNCVLHTQGTGPIDSSGVITVLTCVGVQQKKEETSSQLRSERLTAGNTLTFRYALNAGSFTVMFDALRINVRGKPSPVAGPSLTEGEWKEFRDEVFSRLTNERPCWVSTPGHLICSVSVTAINLNDTSKYPHLPRQVVVDSIKKTFVNRARLNATSEQVDETKIIVRNATPTLIIAIVCALIAGFFVVNLWLTVHNGNGDAKADALRAIRNSQTTNRSHMSMIAGFPLHPFRVTRVGSKTIGETEYSLYALVPMRDGQDGQGETPNGSNRILGEVSDTIEVNVDETTSYENTGDLNDIHVEHETEERDNSGTSDQDGENAEGNERLI